jgi:beta-glucanase (GH16 family)
VVLGPRRHRDSFAQLYGLFEARIKVVKGPGLWPAFWLYAGTFGTDGDEIDVVELLGKEGMAGAHQTVHAGTVANQTFAPWAAISAFGAATDWHVYAVDWRPTTSRS